MPGIERRRQAAQPFLRSVLVVLVSPGFDDRLGVGQAREPVLVEALIAEPAVERFDIGVLIGFARFDQAQGDTAFMRPGQHGSAAELLGIIRAQHPREATDKRKASAVTFVLVGVMGYRGSDTFRWHLLRHNSLVGTPAFHLLSPRVDELEELDWTAHAGGSPIAQAAWQLASGTVDVVAESDQSQTPPDVVFVMLDTLRADALAAYGGDSGWMPALNRLADQGLVFTNLLANASWTRPSVASFSTGLAPEEHGAASWSFSISPGVVTMAEVFKRRGYDTAALSESHRITAQPPLAKINSERDNPFRHQVLVKRA